MSQKKVLWQRKTGLSLFPLSSGTNLKAVCNHEMWWCSVSAAENRKFPSLENWNCLCFTACCLVCTHGAPWLCEVSPAHHFKCLPSHGNVFDWQLPAKTPPPKNKQTAGLTSLTSVVCLQNFSVKLTPFWLSAKWNTDAHILRLVWSNYTRLILFVRYYAQTCLIC